MNWVAWVNWVAWIFYSFFVWPWAIVVHVVWVWTVIYLPLWTHLNRLTIQLLKCWTTFKRLTFLRESSSDRKESRFENIQLKWLKCSKRNLNDEIARNMVTSLHLINTKCGLSTDTWGLPLHIKPYVNNGLSWAEHSLVSKLVHVYVKGDIGLFLFREIHLKAYCSSCSYNACNNDLDNMLR